MSDKPLDYVITYSGAEVSLSRGVPTEADLAISLSRQPRFGGMCRRHWTVVDHSLFTALLAERDAQPPEVQLACLLHDAHEWTGDIPTHFKTREQKELQNWMDAVLFQKYAIELWRSFPRELVRQYDHRALLAEAMVVGPPTLKTSSDILEHFGQRPRLRDVAALVSRLHDGTLGVNPSEVAYGVMARNAQEFLHKLESLRATIATQANDNKGDV